MRTLVIFALALLAGPAGAYDEGEAPPVTIPRLAATAASIEAFAPAGWIVEAKAAGDLDGDGKPDAAFVLKGADPALKFKLEHRTEPLDTNPRILAVALARGAGLDLAVQNATLIPRHVYSNLDDAFESDGLSIDRRAVKVDLHAFANAGGAEMANVSFTFRLKAGTLRAIGHDRTDVHRMSGEMTVTSVNYLSGRKRIEKGTILDDKAGKPVWSKVSKRTPTIDEIDDGLMFGAAR